MTKQHLSLLLLLGAMTGAAYAQGEVYVCTDESGRREYKNTGVTQGCKRVDLPGLTMVPAGEKRAAPQSTAGKPAAAPTNFPKVDDATQKKRDSDRRRILEEEMRAEEKKLAELNAEYKNGQPDRLGGERNYAKYQERVARLKEDIDRTEKNIEALTRELSKL